MAIASDQTIDSPITANKLFSMGHVSPQLFTNKVSTPTSNLTHWLRFSISFNNDLLRERQWVLSTGDVMSITQLTLHVPVLRNGIRQYIEVHDALNIETQSDFRTTMSNFYLPRDIDQSMPVLVN